MERDNTLTRVAVMPDCDLCKMLGKPTPAHYDGATRMGAWAYMCDAHMQSHGLGLGVGRGQELALTGPDALAA